MISQYLKNSLIITAIASMIFVILSLIFESIIKKYKYESVDATITYKEKEIKVSLFIDTGNRITEPETNSKIIFMKKSLIISDICYPVTMETVNGTCTEYAYKIDIKFENKDYNSEKFLAVKSSCDFFGFDGIAPRI